MPIPLSKVAQKLIIISVILTIILYLLFDGTTFTFNADDYYTQNIKDQLAAHEQYFSALNDLINQQLINKTHFDRLRPFRVSSNNAPHDYDELFSGYIRKDITKLSQSTKKLIMIFLVGIEGFDHNIFNSLFNELHKLNPHHVIHLSNTSDIAIYLDQCWSFDMSAITDMSLRFNGFSKHPIHTTTNFCDTIQEKFDNISLHSNDGDIIFISSSFSYPYWSLSNYQHPDIIKLIQWTQNAKPYPIDLRLLILNNDYNKSLSICLKYNDCNQRILLISHMLNTMHTQIMQISPYFWTMINYTHFITNTLKYVPMFQSLMNWNNNNNKQWILKALSNINNINDTNLVINKRFNALQLWSINASYYSFHVQNRWPLFNNAKYMNTNVGNINYNNLYSNYIKKDYNKLEKNLKLIFIVGVEGVGHHFFRTLFDILQNINGTIYVHQNDRPWPKDPLWLILDQCWAFDLWGLIKPPSWLTVNLSYLPNIEQNITHSTQSICNVAQKRINDYSINLKNNSILFMSTHYSFPYDDPILNRYPDFVQLIEWANNAKYPFDVRILILKRDYKTSLISTCINRFGQCTERIPLLSNMLNIIHAQLLQIDKEYWLQINYTDLTHQMMNYASILSIWFNVKLENVQKAIQLSMEKYKKHKQNSNRHGNKKKPQLTKQQLWAINESYYTWHVNNKWPLFHNKYYVVAPDNDQFLRDKLCYSAVLESNYTLLF